MITLDEIKKNNDWSLFIETDPFNTNNLVQGYISHHSGDDYGGIFIEKVNYKACPQLIYCTPKIRYPFDATGHWHFPKAIEIRRFEKLDGTNIFAFSYQNEKGDKFVSYKTRLKPFLGNSKFGPFLEMWNDIILSRYGRLFPHIVLNEDYNLSFELWGARNPHLVKYKETLDASLLFIRRGQTIQPPPLNAAFIKDSPIRVAKMIGLVDKDYIWNYQNAQEEMDKNLIETDDGYLGQEGEVWYLRDEFGKWTLFKCKPHTVENIHWAAGGIGKNIILATCHNAFENWDNPTIENVISLLVEEFNSQEVDKVFYSIEKHLNIAQSQHLFRQMVAEEYKKIGISIFTDKNTVMRALSGKFDKKDMKKVYSVVLENEIK